MLASLLSSWLPPFPALLISGGSTCCITTSTLGNIIFNQKLQYFYSRNELLSTNSTCELCAPSRAHHQHMRVPYALRQLSSWLLPLLTLLISDEGTCRIATSTLANILFNQEPQYFYSINELLVTNSTTKLSAPSRALHQHTRVPWSSQTTLVLTTASSDTSSYLQWRCAYLVTTSTLASLLFNQDLFYFYYGNELLAKNNNDELSAPSRAHHQHTRVP